MIGKAPSFEALGGTPCAPAPARGVGRFLFGERKAPFETDLLERFRQAAYSHQAVYGLPYTVAEGPARKHGGQLLPRDEGRHEPNRLRFLPLHLAMEGFLTLHFGGPDIAWHEYSRQAVATGLSPRWETTYSGREI